LKNEEDAVLMWKESVREMSCWMNAGIEKRAPAKAWDGTDAAKVKFTSSVFIFIFLEG